jgi:hypothetical protein
MFFIIYKWNKENNTNTNTNEENQIIDNGNLIENGENEDLVET